jgi:hypothetical protein
MKLGVKITFKDVVDDDNKIRYGIFNNDKNYCLFSGDRFLKMIINESDLIFEDGIEELISMTVEILKEEINK